MKHQPIALLTAALLLNASLSFAIEPNASADANGKATASTKSGAASASQAAKRKAAAKVKLVDINSAKSGELKKLPGIGDAEAAKIIAGRPYGSKAWLVTQNIISADAFQRLQKLIVAKQPYADPAKNVEFYKNKK